MMIFCFVPSAGQHRVDRVVVDVVTGVASRVAGTAVTGSPSATPPAIPAGKLPICQVRITSDDTVILNSMITDERLFQPQSASDTVQGLIEIASAAEMEAGTDSLKAVPPSLQHRHPSAAKAWIIFDMGTPDQNRGSYNVTSIGSSGAGQKSLNLTTAFSGTGYATVAANGNADVIAMTTPFTASVIVANARTESAGYANFSSCSVAAFGDQ